MAGILTNMWWYVYDPCKIILTGPNVKHTREGIFAEACTWHSLISDKRLTEVQAENWRWPFDTQKYVTIGNAETGEGFSGKHGPHTFFIFDEASGLDGKFYLQARTQASLIYSASNPRAGSATWFRGMFPADNADPGPDESQYVDIPGGRCYLCTVDAEKCVNVESGSQLIPAQISREMLADVLDPIGKQDWWIDCMAHGRFPRQDAETKVFMEEWLRLANQHYHSMQGGTKDSKIRVCGFGLDVGASEAGDPTVLAAAGLEGVDRLFMPESPEVRKDIMRMVEWVLSTVLSVYHIDLTATRIPLVCDEIGPGKGALDRLRQRGVNVLESTLHENKTMYANFRAENYGELARRVNPADAWSGTPFALPDDAELYQELLAHDKIYKPDDKGAFLITPKDRPKSGNEGGREVDTIKKRIGRSPNKSDAAAYAYKAIASLAKFQIPKINRPILAASGHDADQMVSDGGVDPETGRKLKKVRLEDLPEPKPIDRELEDIGSLVMNVVSQMNAEDDMALGERW